MNECRYELNNIKVSNTTGGTEDKMQMSNRGYARLLGSNNDESNEDHPLTPYRGLTPEALCPCHISTYPVILLSRQSAPRESSLFIARFDFVPPP